jgi:hypothetical protein
MAFASASDGLPLGATPSVVGSLDLPDGSFVVHAKVQVEGPDTGATLVECVLDIVGADDASAVTLGPSETATLPLSAGVILSTDVTAELSCTGVGAVASRVKMQAVQADDLDVQP